jgi:hypothetical protein
MIVKVQISIHFPVNEKRALIYDEDRTFAHEARADTEILKLMRKRKKAFFNARIEGGEVQLFDEAPWQDW